MLKIRRFVQRGIEHEPRYTRGPYLTDAAERGTNLVVRLHPHHVAIKVKGTRTWFDVPWTLVYGRGAAIAAACIRKEKLAARKAHRSVKRGRR
jgi:hypothetical protein